MTGRPRMISKSSRKSARCIGSSWSSAACRSASVSARIISRITVMRAASKNMCSVRQSPRPSTRNSRAMRASAGRVGVGAHPEVAGGVGPVEQLGESAAELGRDHRRRAGHHLAAGAVERDQRALAEDPAVGAGQGAGGGVEAELAGADHARQADAAGDHGGVAGHAAAHGQHAAGGVHAADVLGAGLDPHQDRRLVLGGGGLGGLGGEDDAAGGGAGAGGEAGAEDVAGGGGVDLRVQVLDQAARLDAQQRLGRG